MTEKMTETRLGDIAEVRCGLVLSRKQARRVDYPEEVCRENDSGMGTDNHEIRRHDHARCRLINEHRRIRNCQTDNDVANLCQVFSRKPLRGIILVKGSFALKEAALLRRLAEEKRRYCEWICGEAAWRSGILPLQKDSTKRLEATSPCTPHKAAGSRFPT